MDRNTLAALSRDDLIDLIVLQAQQISLLLARIAELEARLGAPGKTPDNSSLPPSKGQKPNLPGPAGKKPRMGRPGVARALAEQPDKVIQATLAACPHCSQKLAAADQTAFEAYDHIDLPPIRPITTRIHRHRGVCPCCRKRFAAPAPHGMPPGSPFGPELRALIIHLHVTQAIGWDCGFAPPFRRLLLRAMGVGRRRPRLDDAKLTRYRAVLDARLKRLLSAPTPTSKAARRLFRAMTRDHADLFRFITRRDVPYTNNASERALRPSVIFRKVTNGFRSKWGADVYAAASTIIATGRLNSMTALQAMRAALDDKPILITG